MYNSPAWSSPYTYTQQQQLEGMSCTTPQRGLLLTPTLNNSSWRVCSRERVGSSSVQSTPIKKTP
ncbi:hypothetical protein E2C01_090268 [Portunus trituberculatus]|uniref:Uncharacterized protein n=1 Tax=Portunus trituberculatus TaxID=210409 RepID=A0A5B7JKY8_PORTR|nr:hypothetical protein [Portunus trituberculatus]